MPRRRFRETNPSLYDADETQTPSGEQDAWLLDQLAKSKFFRRKLHQWGLLETACQIESVEGETLHWDVPTLGISQKAWDKAIHRGIRPVIVFAHPNILFTIPRSTGYYRMLAMVSQKSMNRIGLATARYEETTVTPDLQMAQSIAFHLNSIISRVIESDEEIDGREFDLWRGMAAGSQAQGSWQNVKGNVIEDSLKDLLLGRLREKSLLVEEAGDEVALVLQDGRVVRFADEPDIGIYSGEQILAAVEIKGGIDTAGVLERVGAAIKSLSRAKEANSNAVTVLILQGVSVTQQARDDLNTNQHTVNRWFTVEDVTSKESAREEFFELLGV